MTSQATGTGDAAVDEAYLEQLRDDFGEGDAGAATIRELISLFLTSTPSMRTALEEARAAGDRDTIAELGHQLISRSSWVGARRLTALSRHLQEHAKTMVAGLDEAVGELIAELLRVEVALAAVRTRFGGEG